MSKAPGGQRPRRKPISMRDAALTVVKNLQGSGHVALFAGGCVRDMLMGNDPHDYDIATSAKPDEVVQAFRRTQRVGAQFGVVLVRIGQHMIEVATFRTDLAYHDGRRPIGVEFSNPKEDACRRDFTINGIFFDPIADEVVDHVGGQKDLKARMIRAIGEPAKRFAEDHLRLLRAVRFAARFDFEIEPETWTAMCRYAEEIRRISPERIRIELEAILSNANRSMAVRHLHRMGILKHLWPGADVLSPQVEGIFDVLSALPETARFELSLAAMLLSLTSKQVVGVCDALRCSHATQGTVKWLVEKQDTLMTPSTVKLADLKRLMAHAAFDDLMSLFLAKLKTTSGDTGPFQEIEGRVQGILPDQVAPPPLLTGNDLKALGVVPGPDYKAILDRVYDAQLNDEIRQREEAVALAQDLLKERRQSHGAD
ncbi:MAG: CCA tRNA nucleotidyltransferase [Phycisphaerales bacterium]|nr:CCA tRNA nucleotidyltransferase [Phycisphaerales bacterium]